MVCHLVGFVRTEISCPFCVTNFEGSQLCCSERGNWELLRQMEFCMQNSAALGLEFRPRTYVKVRALFSLLLHLRLDRNSLYEMTFHPVSFSIQSECNRDGGRCQKVLSDPSKSMLVSDSDCSGSDRVTTRENKDAMRAMWGSALNVSSDYHTKLNMTLLVIIFIRLLFQKFLKCSLDKDYVYIYIYLCERWVEIWKKKKHQLSPINYDFS
jgi:hypothetical protein